MLNNEVPEIKNELLILKQYEQSLTLFVFQNGTASTKATSRISSRQNSGYQFGYPHNPYNSQPNVNLQAAIERPCDMHLPRRTLFGCCRSKSFLSKFSSRAKRIDVISRFLFPLLFAIFNLAYWMYYLLAKGSNESYKDGGQQ